MREMTTQAGREAWRTIFDLMFAGNFQGRMSQACAKVGVSPGVMKTLLHLHPGEGVSMRELGEIWQCDASYVTSLADGLEERGLAERRPHPTDRRIKMLALTPKGVAAKERALEVLHETPKSIDVLTPSEQRNLRDLVRKIADAELESGRAGTAAIR
jgi:DNA-binding MarR family transcriptional regulator